MVRFMMVTEVRTDRPDRRVMVNLASVQVVRPRAPDDNHAIGCWICWNTLDEPMMISDKFDVVMNRFVKILDAHIY